jgi:hypothetical protein
MIAKKIEPCFVEKPDMKERNLFNFSIIDPENTSLLDISGKEEEFILPSFKFMAFHDVRAIDFTNTGFEDSHMQMLCNYL